ncbi:MAG: phosphoribosyl-ATP diphosphatase [Gammaproteobacteria bacterium]|nr:phosphoribosyl-ATP diphosphatase [Gammaproteobacteria bacterium]
MSDILAQLSKTLNERKQADPASSYTAALFAAGPEAILKKIGEEATEVVIAGTAGNKSEIVHETADLWFHTLVLLSHYGLTADDILVELKGRVGRSGLDEKTSRNNKLK